jgi:hypothetical protein
VLFRFPKAAFLGGFIVGLLFSVKQSSQKMLKDLLNQLNAS